MCSTAQASITSSSQEPWHKQLLVYGPPYPTPVYLSIAVELKKHMICLRLEIWPSITLTTHAARPSAPTLNFLKYQRFMESEEKPLKNLPPSRGFDVQYKPLATNHRNGTPL